jgi:hypothetical protein
MKYRISICDLDYEIEAKSCEGAVRTAIARYTKMETAQWNRHCSPDRLTRDPTIAEGNFTNADYASCNSIARAYRESDAHLRR